VPVVPVRNRPAIPALTACGRNRRNNGQAVNAAQGSTPASDTSTAAILTTRASAGPGETSVGCSHEVLDGSGVGISSSVIHVVAGFAESPVQLRRGRHDDAEGPFGGTPHGPVGSNRRMRRINKFGTLLDHTNVVGGTGEERDNLNSPFGEVGAGVRACHDNGRQRQETGHVCQSQTRGVGMVRLPEGAHATTCLQREETSSPLQVVLRCLDHRQCPLDPRIFA